MGADGTDLGQPTNPLALTQRPKLWVKGDGLTLLGTLYTGQRGSGAAVPGERTVGYNNMYLM